MKTRFVSAALLLLVAGPFVAAAGERKEDLKEIKRLIIDVERIRRMDANEQKKEVERLYRTIAPRVHEKFAYHLIARMVDYNKDRDKMTPEVWAEKAMASSPDAYQYLMWDARHDCIEILAKRRVELRPFIMADLASKNKKELLWALRVVGEIRDKEFFEPVLKVYEENGEVRTYALQALRYMEDTRAIEPLVKRHPDLDGIAETLSTIQRKRKAAPVLVALLDSNDAKVRARAATALAESGDPALVGRIERLTRDVDPQVRGAAARMAFNLEKDALPKVRSALVLLTRDPDKGVKTYATRWLARQREPGCGPAILEMARDTKLSQQEHFEVVRMMYELTGSYFDYDTSPTGWRPDTGKNQEALRRFAEWVEKNSGKDSK